MCTNACVCVCVCQTEREGQYEGSAIMHCIALFASIDLSFKGSASTHLNGPQFIYIHSLHFPHMSGNQPAGRHTRTHSFDVYFHSFIWCLPKVTGHHVFKLTGFLHPHCVEDGRRGKMGEVEGSEKSQEGKMEMG